MSRLENKSLKSRQGNILLATILVLTVIGIGAFVLFFINRPQSPITYNITPNKDQSSQVEQSSRALSYSKPVSIVIESIGVRSKVIQLGKNPDNTIAVPAGDDFHKAAWYENSPTPGQAGSSIIEGHVDSAKDGASIFFNLNKIKPGDKIEVKRADGTTAVFAVQSMNTYQKENFPSIEIYGPTEEPTLRLITCGGSFNPQLGRYDSNTIVSAILIK